MSDIQSTVTDTLLLLAPPIRLCMWLESVFEAKQAKGEEVPEQFTRWLARWQKIRSELPCEIDALTSIEWDKLKELEF